MKKTTEQKLVISSMEGSKITRIDTNIVNGGTCVEICITSEIEENIKIQEIAKVDYDFVCENSTEIFPIVEASKLSLRDEFLKYKPETKEQKALKKFLLTEIAVGGLSDFRHHIMDASEDENENILFKSNQKPAVGHSAYWWDEKAKLFLPEKNSRLGTKKQYYAFLGVLIKELVKEGFKVSDAWKAVCDDSELLGNYYNSKTSKRILENTCKRKVGRWFDLANTCKILKDYENLKFLLAGGNYNNNSKYYPLLRLFAINKPNTNFKHSTGWIVLDV